jgi:L-alanine-DL-glutamate epimerase-like enolase superfamily enzyme
MAAANKPVTPLVSDGYPAYNTLLFCPVIPNAGHYHEYKNFREVENYVPEGLKVKNGRIAIPGGHGLGLDLSFVKHDVKVVARLSLAACKG